MEPELTQFGSDNRTVTVIKVDIEDRDGADWKKYQRYMTSRSIPYTVILGDEGAVLANFVGYKDAAGIEAVVDSTRP